MKTIATEIELYGVLIRTEIETGFLSLTDLQEAYTRARIANGWNYKDILHDVVCKKDNVERIYYLISVNNLSRITKIAFIKSVEEKGMVKTLKELGVYKTFGKGKTKQAMCDTNIWCFIAMKLRYELYQVAADYLYTAVVFNHIEACRVSDEFRDIINVIPHPDFVAICKELEKQGLEDDMSDDKRKDLEWLESNVAYAIRKGFYTTSYEVVDAIKNY